MQILIKRYLYFSLLIWIVALICSLNNYSEGTILFLEKDRFMDFIHYAKQTYYLGNSEDFFSNRPQYYPFILGSPAAILYSIFSKTFHPNYLLATLAYLSVIISILIFAIIYLGLKIKDSGGDAQFFIKTFSFSILLFFPFWFLLDRANPEGFVFIFLVLGFLFINKKNGLISAIFLGLAASLKFFPAIFSFWFLYRKQYKAFCLSIIAAILFTFIGFWIIGPTPLEAFTRVFSDMRLHNISYHMGGMPSHEIRFYHSLFAVIKNILLYNFDGKYIEETYKFYMLFIPLMGLYLLWFIRNIPPINQLFILVIAMVAFVPLSADYRLIHMLIPIAALLYYISANNNEKSDINKSAIHAIIAPLTLIIIPTSQLHIGLYWIGGSIKFIALIWLMFSVIRNPLESKRLWI